MSNKIYQLALAVLAVTTVVSCGEKKKAPVISEEAVVVRTQPISRQDYSSSLQYSGRLASSSQATLSFKLGGVISKIHVKEGDHVRRGQVLATLDLTEINAQVQQAQQIADKASRDLTRVKNLFADTAATLEQMQNAETQQKQASEALKIASFNRQYAQITAPDNGTIVKKIMNEGELAAPGAPVLLSTGTANDDWVVRFGVSDKDWKLVKLGNAASVSIDAYPAETFKAVVTKLAQSADPTSGTYEVEVKVLPNGKNFAVGMFSTVQLHTAFNQKVTLIPIEALTAGDGKTGYVYLLNNDQRTVTRKKVQIAFVDNDKVAISSGLDSATDVVTDGASYLTDNTKVRLVN